MARNQSQPASDHPKTLVALVGMRFRDSEDFVRKLPGGEIVKLEREPNNAYNRNAVKVFARGRHVGYISAKQVGPIAEKMDRGGIKELLARMAVAPGDYPLIEIDC